MNNYDWLLSKEAINKSKKYYAHFDYRTDLSTQCEYVSDSQRVSSHGFYPFIHYLKKERKYNKSKGKDYKYRDICYSAHIDRCIFQYYNYMLNTLYNERVKKDGINYSAIAYRTDLHKNNIDFAKIAFDYVKAYQSCYVMIGDFTSFFDNLDHQYLKKQWCSLLGVSSLPEDHYNVFKNITKYSKFELTDLLKINHLEDTKQGRRQLNSQSRVLTQEEFKNNKSYIQKNKNSYGIPQGSSISGLLANIYMLEVDKQIKELVTSFNGLYMRYSDDFIVILPDIAKEVAIDTISQIRDVFNETPRLTLQPEKTQYFYYSDRNVSNCGTDFHSGSNCEKKFINFLGFTFDGKVVSIRSKTTSKYYHRMYRKARNIAKHGGYTRRGNRISCRNLYERYSIRGAKDGKGNYFSYISRASRIFGPSESVTRDTKRHMQKIRKALKRRINNTNSITQ